jgi:hypothetical protein
MIEHGMVSRTGLSTFRVEEAKAFCAEALGMEFQGFDTPLHGGRRAWGIRNMAGGAPEGGTASLK